MKKIIYLINQQIKAGLDERQKRIDKAYDVGGVIGALLYLIIS